MNLKRVLVVYIENDTIGDGLFFTEAADALREYVDMVNTGVAGRERCEIYEGPRGTKLTAIGVAWNGAQLPLEKLWQGQIET